MSGILELNDYRTVRNFFRFADAGVLPAPDIAGRASDLLRENKSNATVAMQVIESVRAGIIPSQASCQVAQMEVLRLYERGEREVDQQVQGNT